MKYYFDTKVEGAFDDIKTKVIEALAKEGFGIVTEMNLDEKFKEKLDVDFRRYNVLGACNPSFAYEAVQKEDKIGTMLPCNVVLQELESNVIEIAAVNPMASMMAVENDELGAIANEVTSRLERVINSFK